MIGDMNAFDYQHLAILFNLSPCFGVQLSFAGRNLTRFQRATKGSRQSTGSGSNHIIQRRGMRIVYLGIDTIVFSNFGVNAKHYRGFDLR
jgi:hypothetical protein